VNVVVLSTDRMEGSLWRFVEGCEHGGVIRDGSSTSLPRFRSLSGGGILCAAINHYNGNKCSIIMIVSIPCYRACLKGSSTPAYKGALHGYHGGSGMDTTWSPRLTPRLCLVHQVNPPCVCLQESGMSSLLVFDSNLKNSTHPKISQESIY
jgi:hypothetical protein